MAGGINILIIPAKRSQRFVYMLRAVANKSRRGKIVLSSHIHLLHSIQSWPLASNFIHSSFAARHSSASQINVQTATTLCLLPLFSRRARRRTQKKKFAARVPGGTRVQRPVTSRFMMAAAASAPPRRPDSARLPCEHVRRGYAHRGCFRVAMATGWSGGICAVSGSERDSFLVSVCR